ncbi:MAG: chemotaxis-specific protein-glutamate methyltransferase CheB [Candidatus Omnitrophica bacterium]|nr:chemotaxis-specific protein-glutamate methyltransferase CheB [Candidatus Omnitrophota bacterium]
MPEKIRVLIADDSSLMREAIKAILESDPDIEVIGMAKDGQEAIDKALALKPTVITMDMNMPKKNGIEAIEEIMRSVPTPIIVISTMNVNVIIKALGIGAMDFVCITHDISVVKKDLLAKVKISSRVKAIRRMKIGPFSPKVIPAQHKTTSKIIAIGVSTGGPQALETVLAGIPSDFPAGIAVVQHISEGFINGLAEWLGTTSGLEVKVARSGDVLKKGTVLLAPDKYNFTLNGEGVVILKEPVSQKAVQQIPSIDELMCSVAASYGDRAVGVIMTGMSSDGVKGIREIKHAGGITISQDEKSSVIFGMNKLAIETGCVDRVIPLDRIAKELIELAASV